MPWDSRVFTMFHYSLPANRAEFVVSDAIGLAAQRRFSASFYKERSVVREERRMRIESSPQGKLQETLIATAISAHPYQNFIAGWGRRYRNLRASGRQGVF
jgi:predicted Zn-dependent peptidase